MIAYPGCPMVHGATARAQGVPNRPGGGGRWAENAKKMLFGGNEPKTLLKIKNLAFSGPQNELHSVCKKPQSKLRIWPKIQEWTLCARLPCCHSERSGAERTRRGGSPWTFPPTNSRATCFVRRGGLSMTGPKVVSEARGQRREFPVSDFCFLLFGAYLFPVKAS